MWGTSLFRVAFAKCALHDRSTYFNINSSIDQSSDGNLELACTSRFGLDSVLDVSRAVHGHTCGCCVSELLVGQCQRACTYCILPPCILAHSYHVVLIFVLRLLGADLQGCSVLHFRYTFSQFVSPALRRVVQIVSQPLAVMRLMFTFRSTSVLKHRISY